MEPKPLVHGEPVTIVEISLNTWQGDAFFTWCKSQNLTYTWDWGRWWDSDLTVHRLWFKDPHQALLFKLRWS